MNQKIIYISVLIMYLILLSITIEEKHPESINLAEQSNKMIDSKIFD